jgi:hypothetical protein
MHVAPMHHNKFALPNEAEPFGLRSQTIALQGEFGTHVAP